MAARQRLRAVLEVRRASQPCWRCALVQPRYNSSFRAGIRHTSKSPDAVPFQQILSREVEHALRSFFSPESLAEMEPTPARRSNGSQNRSGNRSSRTVHEPRTRGMSDGRPGTLGIQPQSPLTQAARKPRIRRVSPKHDRDPLIRKHSRRSSLIDTEAKSLTMRWVSKRRPGVVHGNSTTDEDTSRPTEKNSQKAKYPKVDIQDFMAENSGASVHVIKEHLIRKHPKYDGTPSPRYTFYYVHNVRINVRIILQVNRDSPQTERPCILYVAEGDDATRLIHKAGPPLGEREDEDFDNALTSLLDEYENHHTSKFSKPNRMTGEPSHASLPRIGFSPQDRSTRQAALNGSRTSNREYQETSRSLFSTRTSRAINRHYATASVSQRRLLLFMSHTKAVHRVRICGLMPRSTHPLLERIEMGISKESLEASERRLDCGRSSTALLWPTRQVGLTQVRLATPRTCSPSREKTRALPRLPGTMK